MQINVQNLEAAFTGFKVVFQAAFAAAEVNYTKVATEVNSTTKQEVYPWLGQNTKFREWVGERVIQNLAAHSFTIKNRHFENTVSIDRDDFEDDTFGIFSPMIAQLGQDSKIHPDLMVFNLLKSGTSSLCYDGQYYFDADHPGWDANGKPTSVSNVDAGGSGPWWYLMDTSKIIKPLIFQKRKNYQFVPMTRPDDLVVFKENKFVYGVDARVNAGYGLWQMAYASNQPLDSAHYGAARAAMGAIRAESGDVLDLKPNLLVIPPALEGAANTLLKATMVNNTTNTWAGTAEILMTGRVA
jgi:phage major head subunit gpT-like protein